MSMDSAAAAGRLVVGMLFGANAVAYIVKVTPWASAGMILSLVAATAGYFSASLVAYDEDEKGQRVLLGSIAASVASGLCFLIGV